MSYTDNFIVTLRDDLILGVYYNSILCTENVLKFKGQKVAIKYDPYKECYALIGTNDKIYVSVGMFKETINNLLPKLETGMFGELTDGEIFVVVNDILVYEFGRFSTTSKTEYPIKRLVSKCKSFDGYKDQQYEIIYERI